jgi:hypothetical protein
MRSVNTIAQTSELARLFIQNLVSTTTLRMSTAPPPKTQTRKRSNRLTKKPPSVSTNSPAGPAVNVLIWVLSVALVGVTLALVRRILNGMIVIGPHCFVFRLNWSNYVVDALVEFGRSLARCRINYWPRSKGKTCMMRCPFEQGYTRIPIRETK